MKTNKQLNTAHAAKEQERVRPAAKQYDWAPLEAVMAEWAKAARE